MNNVLKYKKPAKEWMEGLPIGNGRLAAMVWGDYKTDILTLNHEWLWRGVNRNRKVYEGAKYLPEIRNLLKNKEYFKATSMANTFLGGEGGMSKIKNRVDPYQVAGELIFKLDNVNEYIQRELNINTGISRTIRKAGDTSAEGITIVSEFFADCVSELLMSSWVAENKKVDDKKVDDKIVEHKIADDKKVDDKIANDKTAEDKTVDNKTASNNKLADDNVADNKFSGDLIFQRVSDEDAVYKYNISNNISNNLTNNINKMSNKLPNKLLETLLNKLPNEIPNKMQNKMLEFHCAFNCGIEYKVQVYIFTDGNTEALENGFRIEQASYVKAVTNIATSAKDMEAEGEKYKAKIDELIIEFFQTRNFKIYESYRDKHINKFSSLMNKVEFYLEECYNSGTTDYPRATDNSCTADNSCNDAKNSCGDNNSYNDDSFCSDNNFYSDNSFCSDNNSYNDISFCSDNKSCNENRSCNNNNFSNNNDHNDDSGNNNENNIDITSNKLDITTDERIEKVKSGQTDNTIFKLYFDYGRYLLLSSSICGELPANLQGKWNDSINPPWECDYHFDINLQMNYWMAEPCNMPECAEMLIKYVKSFMQSGREAARKLYGCRGIYLPLQTDAWGISTPESFGYAVWIGAAPWIAQHLWWHYIYSGDKDYLKNTAYEFFAAVAEFYEDYLIEDEHGILQIMPSQSPENRFQGTGHFPVSIGVSSAMDVQLAYDALKYAIQSAEILKIDEDRVIKWKQLQSKLPLFKIGSDGRLLEWNEEMEEVEPGHRHLSHLYGLYPSELFTPEKRPAQYNAAVKSLHARLSHGGGHTGWSRAWVSCIFARIGDSDGFLEHYSALIKDFATISLLDLHPPKIFQIDGNLGAVAAVIEAIIGYHDDKVHLLKALPEQWKNGYLKGIKVPGGHIINIKWEDSKVTALSVEIGYEEKVVVKYKDKEITVEGKMGQIINVI